MRRIGWRWQVAVGSPGNDYSPEQKPTPFPQAIEKPGRQLALDFPMTGPFKRSFRRRLKNLGGSWSRTWLEADPSHQIALAIPPAE